MGMLSKVRSSLAAGVKALRRDQLRFPSRSLVYFDLLDSRLGIDEVETRIGDGTSSDVLMSTIRWIQRAAVEAPMIAMDAEDNPLPDSDLQRLIDKPNPFYGFDTLVAGTVYDLDVSGNAYWLPVEDGNGQLAELWWTPSNSIEPIFDTVEPAPGEPRPFIDYYRYTAGGVTQNLRVQDVIHFRQGIDPRNIRLGLSPLRGLYREIWTDNEAAEFTAALLKNGGVPGLVISPRTDDYELTQEEIQAAKAKLETEFAGSRGRGRVLGLTGPVEVTQFGFDVKQLDLSSLRDVSEERITAALGVASAVIGFGAGLQTTRVGATMREMRKGSYQNGVVPLWNIIEGTVNLQLIPQLRSTGRNAATKAVFDVDSVEALQEDQDARAHRVDRLVRSGVITRRQALIEMGFDGGDEGGPDDVYLLPLSTIEVPRSASGDGNGNGRMIVEAEVEERGLLQERGGLELKHEPTLLEQRIIENAPRATPTRPILLFADAVDRIRTEAQAPFSEQLVRLFDRMGAATESAVLDLMREEGEIEQRATDADPETKQDSSTLETVAVAILLEFEDELRALFGSQYLRVAREIAKQMKITMGIDFIITDQVQVEILRRGGLRAGLLDLTQQARDALFDALAEARAEGLAGDSLARRIREHITAGPWRDAATRARVIARTEAANAANVATIEAAREMEETEHMMVLDNRAGFDDETCSQINGTIVTIAEAGALGLAHPNCTRSFTAINSLLLEELDPSTQ